MPDGTYGGGSGGRGDRDRPTFTPGPRNTRLTCKNARVRCYPNHIDLMFANRPQGPFRGLYPMVTAGMISQPPVLVTGGTPPARGPPPPRPRGTPPPAPLAPS